jgi:uncharacterized membrane protein
MWLRKNAAPDDVVLEAEGPEYSDAARISARTGLPTVVGWPNHEWQERGALEPVLARVNDVKTIYTSEDAALVRDLLTRYNVRYVYEGNYERERYGLDLRRTYEQAGRLVFDSRSVRIYAVGTDDQSAGRR